jgi:hypothetical protein
MAPSAVAHLPGTLAVRPGRAQCRGSRSHGQVTTELPVGARAAAGGALDPIEVDSAATPGDSFVEPYLMLGGAPAGRCTSGSARVR